MRDPDRLTVTLLGTGTSTGIPVIGCSCRVCRSRDPRDHRTRCSCLIRFNDVCIVVDTGPDFRQQALREGITRVDAVFFSHHHFDHVMGLDDVRPFCFGNPTPVPCYAHPETVPVLKEIYRYIFEDGTYPGISNLILHDIRGPVEVQSRYGTGTSVRVEPVDLFHGDTPLYGFRVGRFAYLTDTNFIPEASFDQLHDLDVLVLDALRHRPHRTHFSISEAVQAAQRIRANRTYFIHMTHSLLHAEEEERLPDTIHFGYDGLTLEVQT